MERYCKFDKKNLYAFLTNYLQNKFCLQLNTDDLTWRIFFQGSWKNVTTWFLLKDFLPFSRQSKPCNRVPDFFLSPQKIPASRSYMALWLPEKVWCKSQNDPLAPKSPIFKMVDNHQGADFHICGQNSNNYNLHIIGKEILSGLILS